MAYLLGIDLGTSGTKAIVADGQGRVLADALFEHPLYTPRQGWNEQEPADWGQTVYKSCKAAIAKSGVRAGDIIGVGLSGQMHGLVPLDGNGNVLRKAILWNDQRTEEQCAHVIAACGGLDGLLKLTNNNMLPGYQGGKILWIRENEPQIYSKMKKALLPKDYIRFLLTGEYCTEVSDASGTGLFSVKERRFSCGLIDKLGLDAGLFPRCVESSGVTGFITKAAAEATGLAEGTAVYGGGGDAVAQTTGMGIIEEGVLGITIGTAGNAVMSLRQYKENAGGKLQFFCNNEEGLYHAMGVQLAAGGSYQWYRNVFCEHETETAREKGLDAWTFINEAAEASPPGANRLLWFPYLSGERCPYSDPKLRASFIGLSQLHKKGDVNRAVMEGVVFGLRQISELLAALMGAGAGAPEGSRAPSNAGEALGAVMHIVASGGAVKSPLWKQLIADIFGLPVRTVSGAKDGGAFGAVLIAGVGAGIWKNLKDACSVLKTETLTEPELRNKKIYDELFEIYCAAYNSMKPIYEKLSRG